jgi:predicted Mrr-cat superfamily restriction endonuclease
VARTWGIHGRRPQFEMLRDRHIALERAGVGDLVALGNDRRTVERRLRESYPDRTKTKDGTIQVWTTVLLRFAFEPVEGDLVVHPDPANRTFSIGRISGAYRFTAAPRELHTRTTEWLVTGLSRDRLSDAAKQTISRRTAFFEVKDATEEFNNLAAEASR